MSVFETELSCFCVKWDKHFYRKDNYPIVLKGTFLNACFKKNIVLKRKFLNVWIELLLSHCVYLCFHLTLRTHFKAIPSSVITVQNSNRKDLLCGQNTPCPPQYTISVHATVTCPDWQQLKQIYPLWSITSPPWCPKFISYYLTTADVFPLIAAIWLL